MYGKTEREDAAYLAGREQVAKDIALWIERHGLEHDRMAPGLGDCIAVFRGGNITCFQPINE